MTVSKSTAASSASSHLSILGTHPHPQLHPHHLKSSSSLASASVTKTTVDTTTTMGTSSQSNEKASSILDSKMSKNPSSWDPQDDILLRHLKEVKKLGWKDISQYFTNRTPNACQFRWRRLKSGNLKSNKTAHVDVTDYPGKIKVINDSTDGSGSGNTTATPAPAKANNALGALSSSSAIAIPISAPPKAHPGLTSAPNSASATPSMPYSRSPFSLAPTSMNNNYSLGGNNGAGSKFFKTRSNSHSFSKSLNSYNNTNNNSNNNHNNNSNGYRMPSEEENVGFIPKIIVRSRRSSFAQPLTTSSTTSHLTSALNTTLNTSKTRKNSFASRSRRSSFNLSSSTPSRRSSIIVAPNSLSGMFSLSTGSSTPKIPRRDSTVKVRTHRSASSSSSSSSSASYMDLPTTSIPHVPRPPSRIHLKLQHQQQQQNHMQQQYHIQHHHVGATSQVTNEKAIWSSEEDQLLSENGFRNLSIMELSILLPNKSEREIRWRLDVLSSSNSPARSNEVSESPLHSPRKSVTPEDTAIDEDTCDEADHDNNAEDYDEGVDPLHQEQSPSDLSQETTPGSIISSTTTNDDSSSVSADHHHSRNENDSDDAKTLRNFHSRTSPSNYSSSSTTTSLPSINSILKGTL